MKKRLTSLALLLLLTVTAAVAQKKADGTKVQVEFITPSIVHIVKGQPTKSLVVTAKPENVAVTQKGNTWTSSKLTVKLNPET
jgi:alpha-D-xyloside xylohydrolase